MDSEAKKTLEEVGRDLGVNAEELGRIRQERKRLRLRFAVISLATFVASFIAGAAVSEWMTPSRSTYPYAAALPLLGIAGARGRAKILGVVAISAVAFAWGFLVVMMQWPPKEQPQEWTTYYGVFGR